MADQDKSRAELVAELQTLRARLAHLETEQADRVQESSRLEALVEARTAAFAAANAHLRQEIAVRKRSEETLRRERDRFARLAETSPVGITIVNTQGQITFANARAEEVLHLAKDNIVQRTYNAPEWRITDYDGNPFPEEDLPFNRVMKDQHAIYDIYHAIETPDGQRTLLVVSGAPLFNDAGEIDEMVFTVEDVTERRRAEIALQESRQRYYSLFNSMIDGYALHEIICDDAGNPVDYRFLDINPAFETYTGLSRDIIGKTVSEVLPGTESDWIETYGRVALKNEVVHFENYVRDLEKWFEVVAFSPDKGRFVTIFHDITRRELAEQARHETERRYRNIVESIPIGIHRYQLEEDGRLVFMGANPAADRILGVDHQQFVGKTVEQAFPPLADTEVPDRYRDVATKGVTWYAEQINYVDEQIQGAYEVHAFQTSPGRMVAAFQDITERKQNDLERQRYVDRLHMLREIDKAILAAETTAAIAQAALQRIRQLVPFVRGSVTVFDAEHDQTTILAVHLNGEVLNSPHISLTSMAKTHQRTHVLWRGEIYVVHDLKVKDDLSPTEHALLNAGVRSYVNVPLMMQDELIGSLNLGRSTPGTFGPDELDIARQVADQLAIAIWQARLFEAELKRRQIAEILVRAVTILNSSLDLNRVLAQILRLLNDVIGYDSASILLLEGDEFVIIAGYGFDRLDRVIGLRFPVDPKFPNGRIMAERQPVVIDDIAVDYPHFQTEASTYESGHIRSWMGVPLLLRDRLLGMITLDRVEVRPFTQEDVDLALAFAHQSAATIENAQLYEQVQAHAVELEQRVKERTAELEQAKERAEAILNSVADAMLITDAEGIIVSVNPAVLSQTGYRSEELIGLSTQTIPDSVSISPQAFQAMWEAAKTKGHSRIELVIRRKDGTCYDADISVAPLRQQDGGVRGYVIGIRDISALKEIQRMREAFVSNVSHELRTPITNLKLRQHLLIKQPDRADVHVPVIQRETDRLARIIDDLLQLSRLDQRRVRFRLQPIDLNDLARQYVEDRRPLAEDKGLALSLVEYPNLPLVEADEGLLGQVLSILLTNALNYTPRGGQVRVRLLLREQNGQPWSGIAVTDTGPGIPPAEQGRLFERFFRGTVGRESGAPGTGLGLAILKEIVDGHGGMIEVQSTGVPGEGATFTIWLPVKSS